MKITVLGAGGAFAPISRGNSAFYIEHGDRRILVDCGTTVPYVLRDEMGIPLQSITDIIVTHCHGDHIGGLEQLLYSCKYMPGSAGKPNIWAPRAVMNGILTALQPGMGWAQDGSALYAGEEFFIPREVDTAAFPADDVHGLSLLAYPVPHVGNMPCYAYLIGGKLFISGDTNEPVWPSAFGSEITAELIFHEAEFGFKTGVHCPVADIRATGSPEMLAKTWLYHCAEPVTLPPPAGEIGTEFAGFLQKGMVFEL